MKKSVILTKKELKVIERKLSNKKLGQQDYNYLSTFIRPKLREMSETNAKELLNKLSYNQKAISINNKIKKLILSKVRNVKAIVVYGSTILNNYENYNDIDVLIITGKKLWKTSGGKYKVINEVEKLAKEQRLNLDIQIISEETYESQSYRNPNLIYQLKNSKIIYGKIKLPSISEIYKMDLYMKLDYSTIDDIDSSGEELYKSLRNIILVKLLSNGIVDNNLLNIILTSILGEEILYKLKSNIVSRTEKKNVLQIIKLLEQLASEDLKNQKWEKKRILNL